MPSSPCPLCGSRLADVVVTKGDHSVLKCEHCGFLGARPVPTQDDIRNLYGGDFFRGRTAFSSTDYFDYPIGLQRRNIRRLRAIERMIRVGSALDLGCATGHFLALCKERDWDIQGVEIAPEIARETSTRLDAKVVPTVADVVPPHGGFDLITMWEFIEHIADPVPILHQIHTLLRPGGLLALSTPNNAHWRAIETPEAWSEFTPPVHLSFFTPCTLKTALTSTGFEPKLVRPIVLDPVIPRNLRRTLNSIKQRLGDRRNRVTTLWWIYSVFRRLVSWPPYVAEVTLEAIAASKNCDFRHHRGIEVYARARSQ